MDVTCRLKGCDQPIVAVIDITDAMPTHTPGTRALGLECLHGHVLGLLLGTDQLWGLDETDVLALLNEYEQRQRESER